MFGKRFTLNSLNRLLEPREREKLKALAAACGQECDTNFVLTTLRNLLKVVPASVKPVHLVPHKIQDIIANVGREGDLVVLTLTDGTRLYTLPSRQQYRNYYYCFRHLVPRHFTPESYQACHDVQTRFIEGSQIIERLIARGMFVPGLKASIMECGAYNGWKALGFARHVGVDGKLLVVEMDKRQHDIARKNLADNLDHNKYILEHVGVYNAVQKRTYTFEHHASHTLITPDEHMHHTQASVVHTDTLDNIIDRADVDVWDFINIQSNGSELESVQGLERNLNRTKLLYLGTHYSRGGVSIRYRCVDYLLDRGCRIYKKEGGEVTSITQVPRQQVGAVWAVPPAYVDTIVPTECD